MKDIEYYIHIPFCIKKCRYCDFLSFSCDRETKKKYVDQLCEEIKGFDEEGKYRIRTIFIGGGTPSVIEEEDMKKILSAVTHYHSIDKNAEITVEGNPGTLDEEKLLCYRELGINRLSMGVQSFSEEELKLLGRIHTSEDVYKNFESARKSGFTNINLDLMSALPKQSLSSWMETLRRAAELEPEHISAYSLIIEEGTPFYQEYALDERRKEAGERPLFLPSEELERSMYYETKKFLLHRGYGRYEISNYAKNGRECLHNIGYWERRDYRGFGLGAASMVENQRFSNTSSMDAYLNGVTYHAKECLSMEEQIEETMFLGLRMMKGVKRKAFKESFGDDMMIWYGKIITKLLEEKLVEFDEERLKLTDKGVDLSNYVSAQFLF